MLIKSVHTAHIITAPFVRIAVAIHILVGDIWGYLMNVLPCAEEFRSCSTISDSGEN